MSADFNYKQFSVTHKWRVFLFQRTYRETTVLPTKGRTFFATSSSEGSIDFFTTVCIYPDKGGKCTTLSNRKRERQEKDRGKKKPNSNQNSNHNNFLILSAFLRIQLLIGASEVPFKEQQPLREASNLIPIELIQWMFLTTSFLEFGLRCPSQASTYNFRDSN